MTDGRPGPTGASAEERIRAADWSGTAMGPAEDWPASLRIALSICLSSRFPMLVWWGPQLTVFYNDAYLPLLGTKHPTALGRPAAEVWAEAWGDLGPLAAQVLTGGGATFSQDQQLFLERHGYLEETYWTFSYSPVPDDDGGIGGIFIAVSDTTGRVLGESRLRALHDLGELSTASVGTLEQACSAVVGLLAEHRAPMPFAQAYLRTPDGTDVQVVASAGVAPGSAVLSGALPGPDADAAVRRVAARGVPEVVGGLREGPADWYLPGPVGPAVPEQAVVLPMTVSGAREPIGVLVVGVNPYRELDADYRSFFDLVAGHVSTAMTDAQAYLAERRRAEALAELDRAKTDFFSNVSHEFRTPLALIAGPVQELRSVPALKADPRAREELAVIERNAQRLGKLVNTLLEFSRLQAGRIDARFEPVDLTRTTAELASVFRSAVERAGLEFVVDCRPLDQPVYLDRDLWERVVLNLLSNALKFTFTGSITVRLDGGPSGACLTVSDTGTGVPPEELPRLFERFHRVANARSRSGEGSGIGLAMVRELVTLHGGTIEAESAPGVGTTFRVTLPFGSAHLPPERLAAPSTDAPAVSASAAPFVAEALRWLPRPDGVPADDGAPADDGVPADDGAPAPAAVAGSGGRVLVADDNADMREYLVRLLAPHYDVVSASDGQAALDQALADPPDLVVSDIMMPRLDGMQLVAALRRDERTSRVPVVLLSARAGQQAAVQGLATGADDYLVKPFSAEELLARVGAHLSLGRARRAAEERFTAMADLAPALIWVADPAGRRVFVNRGWAQFTGRAVSEELGQGWADRVHPEDLERYGEVVAAAAGRREGWEVEFRLLRSDGAYHWLLERAVPIGSGDGFAGFVGSCTDINARYRETERQMLLAEVGAVLDRETGVEAQLGALARLVVDHRLAEFCGVVLAEDDGQLRVAAVAASDPAVEGAMAALDPYAGLSPTIVETGRSALVAELPEHYPGARPPEQGGVVGARSALAVPLQVRGRVLAVLGLGRRGDAPTFTEDDRELVEEVAARAALAVDNAMLLADERAAARRLALLQGATAELSAATTPVEVAEAAAGHIRQLTGETSRVAIYELDPSHRALLALTISGGQAESRRLWATLPLTAQLAVTTAVTERRALWIEDIADHPPGALAPELMASLRAYGLAANVALPLTVAGRVVGVIGIGFAEVQSFSASERAMLLAVAEQCAQALDRARLYRAEQGIAETLQRSLLPARLPELERLALAARYLPGAEGTQAGGDWYDVVHLVDDRVVIAVGDVVGQGPAAAAVMGQLRSALSAALLQGCGPAEALELLDLFASRLPGALASTAACLVVDAEAGTVRWARAGHPPPLVVTSDGQARFLDGQGSGTVLGVPGRAPYTEGSFTIEPGATLLLYTDGLAERRGEPLDEGLARVRDVAARHATADPGRLTTWLLDDVLADTDQPDDVAVIAARVLPVPLGARLLADPAQLSVVRRAVSRWSIACGLDDDLVEDLQLALGEALSNAVEHAYAGGGDGECTYSLARRPDGSVVAEVTDTGAWRPPPADKGYRGRGLELISALAQDVEVVHGAAAPGGTGTCVRFRFLPQDGPADEPARRPSRHAVPIGTADDEHEARVVESRVGAVVQLAVEGTLDIATVGTVTAAVAGRLRELPRRTPVLLDLSPTSYLASAGVGMVLELRARAAELGLTLRVRTEPGSPPDRILTLAGLADELQAR